MAELIASLVVFVFTHALPAAPGLREPLVRRLGLAAYLILYSLLSLVVITWLAVAYARAPFVGVWEFALWQRWVPVLIMPIACILLAGALLCPNPFSISISRAQFDSSRPGVVAITRHPLMWAFILWAGAHLIPNGDLASVILFGFLLVLSLAGPISLDAKARRGLGAAAWAEQAKATSNIPFAAIITGRARLDGQSLGLPVLGGLMLYAGLIGFHEPVIGVAPWPF
ncbi:MAG: NnrU family protein [Rhodospirillales bacterium]|nr:NnrU family protein [Rhodospirillales bacterium]